jgi:uncharacterized membrane protein YphA (DoxX/SURF4 family)
MEIDCNKVKKITFHVLCLLYMLLFTYAAMSKLLDFENFKVQLGQSPLLSAFALFVAWTIPLLELTIVVFFLIDQLRQFALYLSFGLMAMFSIYIFIILNYSSFVPCSCGGILEKMGWKQHLVFNLVFLIFAAVAIFINPTQLRYHNWLRHRTGTLSALALSGAVIVTSLFLMSENITHYHNKLVRRFPHWPAVKVSDTDLHLNSYYIAGIDSSNIYLGNNTAPFLVTVFNKALQYSGKHLITPKEKELRYHAVQIRVQSPYFYVFDGIVPCIFRGRTKDWKPKLLKKGGEFFTLVAPIDSTSVAVRTHDSHTGESIIGILDLRDTTRTLLNPRFLQKQRDGVFDTDGHLLYSAKLQKLIYLYAYRNQYTVADNKGAVTFRGNTIDTISHANLKIATLKSRGQRKFAKPPLFVNKMCAVSDNLLFVNSAIPGPYEDNDMWKRASIIDTYNLSDRAYLFSFCIYDEEGQKMKSFTVMNNNLYALIGNHIIRYDLRESITKYYNH